LGVGSCKGKVKPIAGHSLGHHPWPGVITCAKNDLSPILFESKIPQTTVLAPKTSILLPDPGVFSFLAAPGIFIDEKP
jgi:hypothetical protein